MEKICVMGLGYVGLPTASIFATQGFAVLGVDIRPEIVAVIQRGEIHIAEPGLDVLVKSAVLSENLTAATAPAAADVFILAVPTPLTADRKPDLSFVEAATDAIVPLVQPGNLVILESTVPVGTTEKVVAARLQKSGLKVGKELFVAHCPERVLPGHVLKELVENDRVIGGINVESAERARALYRKVVNGEIYLTDCPTAEMAKLVENAFRDVNIAFANELSLVCDKLGVNVWELIKLANRHPRVNILQPGPGVGGHCVALDPWLLIASAPEGTHLIQTARAVNQHKTRWVVERVRMLTNRLKEPIVACLGLAYKNDIDDLRESPAVEIVSTLANEQVGRMLVVEPYITVLPPALAPIPELALTDLSTALREADIVVLLTHHRAFAGVDRERLKEKFVVDTRGIWE
ncbi:MAG: UDP-N-acetyl-D-mannosamine dehydrogenase [Deltaproteobacteria bacterium]|nr:UDP-N-acetyl-D-mannosamine dehydrogenase [Deltaproteobacteria bacterium]